MPSAAMPVILPFCVCAIGSARAVPANASAMAATATATSGHPGRPAAASRVGCPNLRMRFPCEPNATASIAEPRPAIYCFPYSATKGRHTRLLGKSVSQRGVLRDPPSQRR